METKDCNGNILQTGDTVQPIKDLQVKGSSQVFKKGEAIKKIRLTDDPDFVEVKGIYLRTEFLKKRK
ncbi:MAG TPA: alkylphosphonate utilization protein [Candidatus Absconditabacterales bacterium]|nr:alkylphosphonate utilization protein [Candidatus Absconditabacterales bacterium]HRU49895.1 alkylphosphonate utilization protein [Candidatus Absconditabacterales bacterium]